MAKSYPSKYTSSGIWKVTDVAKNLLTEGTWPSGSVPGTRAVFGGGATPGYSDIIDYATISTAGNAVDFGDLTVARYGLNKGASSFTRGVITAGEKASPYNTNVLDYITIPSTGNAADFGDITTGRFSPAGQSNATRGIWSGGGTPSVQDIIDYVQIASLGDATDFGNLSQARMYVGGGSSPTRALTEGGLAPSAVNTIDFIEQHQNNLYTLNLI